MDGIGSTVNLTRGADGRIIFQIRDAQNVKIGDAAYVEGSVDFQMGSTESGDVTQFTFKGLGEDVDNEVSLQNSDGYHYNLTGDSLDVNARGGNAERTIQVDGTNTNVDLSIAGGNQFVYMSEQSSNNNVNLGYGNDNYVDAGKFNSVTDNGGANRFETMGTSRGAVIKAGNGADQITIGGDYGVIDAGGGANNINTVGFWGEVYSDETAYRNIIMSGQGDDTITDNGGFNLFLDEGGVNKFTAGGISGIAYMGEGSQTEGVFKNSASHTYVFSTEDMTINGKEYNLYEVMAKDEYSWGSLYKYLEQYSQVSEEDTRSLYNQGVIDAEMYEKLITWFGENAGEPSISASEVQNLVS